MRNQKNYTLEKKNKLFLRGGSNKIIQEQKSYNQKTSSKMTEVNPPLLVISIKLIKRQRIDKNHYPVTCCLKDTHFSFKDTKRMKLKEQGKKSKPTVTKRAGVALLVHSFNTYLLNGPLCADTFLSVVNKIDKNLALMELTLQWPLLDIFEGGDNWIS